MSNPNLPGAAPLFGGGNEMSEAQVMQMQQSQMKDFLMTYNKTSEICFNDCAKDFTTGRVTDKESECGKNCLLKFLEYSGRVGTQFMKRNNLL